MKDFRIIFMGTPEFAVPSLKILIENNYTVVAVITAPDKPRGRGQKLIPSPVKLAALEHDIPVLQPTNLKSPEFYKQLQQYNPNLQVVVAFRMLPEVVWSYPEYGTFNLHASLLPQYRGAAPINWAIINGEEVTGLTTFLLQHEIDTGNIIEQEKVAVLPEDNAGSLHDKMMAIGAQLVLKTVNELAGNSVQLTPQKHELDLKTAPKLSKETTRINWQKSAREVNNFIRGLSPYPAAWTELNGDYYKLFAAHPAEQNDQLNPGEFITDNKSYLKIKCDDRMLDIQMLQKQGKKRMEITEFLRGNQL